MTKKILTLTANPALDKSADVPKLVADTKLRCGAPRFDPGGGGVNVARAIKILGGEALALFPAGGLEGERLRALLKAEGVASDVVAIKGATRENLTVTEGATGRQYRFSFPGPTLDVGELAELTTRICNLVREVDFLVISGGLAPGVADDFYARMIFKAKKAGARVILDVAGPPFEPALHEGVYLVRVNRTDFHAITGVFPKEPADIEPFVESWLAHGWAEVVVTTLATRGTVLMTGERCVEIIPPPVKVKSAVGAGDSFVGGLTLALAKGWTLEAAAAYGTAALLSAFESEGTGLCKKASVEHYFREMTKAVR